MLTFAGDNEIEPCASKQLSGVHQDDGFVVKNHEQTWVGSAGAGANAHRSSLERRLCDR
jgi:hypothetical protein